MTINESKAAENTALTTDDGEWTLQIGCHRGTMMSRDSTATNCKFYSRGEAQLQSLDDCIQCAEDYAKNWQCNGLYVWFADAVSPSGKRFPNLVPSVHYSS